MKIDRSKFRKHIDEHLVLPYYIVGLISILYLIGSYLQLYGFNLFFVLLASATIIYIISLIIYERLLAHYVISYDTLRISDNGLKTQKILLKTIKRVYFCQDSKRNTRSPLTENDKFLELHTTQRYKPYRIAPKSKTDFLGSLKLYHSSIEVAPIDLDPGMNEYYQGKNLNEEILSKWGKLRRLITMKPYMIVLVFAIGLLLLKVFGFRDMSWFKFGMHILKFVFSHGHKL
ncbi:MAG: hypothetical protein ABI844_07190 [Saprospiraceae bacterium]